MFGLFLKAPGVVRAGGRYESMEDACGAAREATLIVWFSLSSIFVKFLQRRSRWRSISSR